MKKKKKSIKKKRSAKSASKRRSESRSVSKPSVIAPVPQATKQVKKVSLNDAVALHQSGDADGARRIYEAILSQHPDHPDALHLLGVLLYQSGDSARAKVLIQKAIGIREQPVYHGNLGNVLKAVGEKDAALVAYRRAIELDPKFAQAHLNLGMLQHETGQSETAIASLKKAIEIQPDFPEAFNNLAKIYREQGRTPEALKAFQKAVKLKPDYAEAHNNMGNIFKDRGDTERAIACYEKAAKAKPDFVQVYVNMGNTLVYDQRRLDQAAKAFEKVRQLMPENEWAIAGLAKVVMRKGDFEGAYQLLKPAVDRGSRNVDVAITFSEVAGRYGEREKAINLMLRLLEAKICTPDQDRHLHYNLGDLYDEAGDYDKAFHHYQIANDSRKLVFNRREFETRLDHLMKVFAKGYGDRLPKAVNRSVLPVFIVGMPRSGTSLVEQIVSSHSQCYGAGELPYVPRLVARLSQDTKRVYPLCLNAMTARNADVLGQGLIANLMRFSKEASRITDKMPQNFLHLGFVSLIVPGARIIHCARDPRDTSLSIFFQNFSDGHAYAANLSDIGYYYRGYRRLMAHWEKTLESPMMTVVYEDLVADQENMSRRIIDFLDLPWEDACLSFYKARRSVSTASFHQVRQPIYKKSLARWQRYEKFIDPLMAEVGDFVKSA